MFEDGGKYEIIIYNEKRSCGLRKLQAFANQHPGIFSELFVFIVP